MSKSEVEQTANDQPQHKLHKLCRTCIYTAAGIVLCLALLTGVAKLALDALEQQPQYAADWLSEQLGRNISLKAMMLSWNDGAPLLQLRGIKVKTMGLQADSLMLAQAEIRFDALASLRQIAPKISNITVRGAHVRLRRGKNGQWLIAGVASQGRYAADDALSQALAALPQGVVFSIENAHLGIEDVLENRPHGERLEFTPVSLNLRKLTNVSRLAGTIGLPGGQQHALRFSLRWAHDAGTPLKASKLALVTQDVPLAKFPWLAELLDLDAVDGNLGLTLDINIHDGTVTDASGQISLSNAALRIRKAWPSLQFETLRSLLEIKNIPQRLAVKLFEIGNPQSTA